MQKYPMVAVVEHTVSDTVHFDVVAEDAEDAMTKAGRFLEKFPGASSEPNIPFAYIEHRQYRDADILELAMKGEEVGA